MIFLPIIVYLASFLSLHRVLFISRLLIFCLVLVANGCIRQENNIQKDLMNVSGHLPDLAFNLVNAQGKKVDQSIVSNKIVLLYFGYVHCPDVCPTTLVKLTSVITRLGKAADNVRILFVSVDPNRDTPLHIAHYSNAFDPVHIIGLSGTHAQIYALTKRYRAAYETIHKNDDAYEITHSAGIYIFDRHGKACLIAMEKTNEEAIYNAIRKLLEG